MCVELLKLQKLEQLYGVVCCLKRHLVVWPLLRGFVPAVVRIVRLRVIVRVHRRLLVSVRIVVRGAFARAVIAIRIVLTRRHCTSSCASRTAHHAFHDPRRRISPGEPQAFAGIFVLEIRRARVSFVFAVIPPSVRSIKN